MAWQLSGFTSPLERGQGADPEQDALETETAEDTEGEEDQKPSDEVLTMDQVEENDSPDSCWAVMDRTVYDLTDWIEDHPGGSDRIEGLCGTDAAEAFESQHGGAERPEGQLAEFEIGTLEG